MASHLATEQGKFLPNPRVPPGETSYLADGATVERATKGKGTFVRSFGTVASRGERGRLVHFRESYSHARVGFWPSSLSRSLI